jgi:hypothetical protein
MVERAEWLTRQGFRDWAQEDSNLQPRDYESPALPLSYGPAVDISYHSCRRHAEQHVWGIRGGGCTNRLHRGYL